jgi:hypothetical protein
MLCGMVIAQTGTGASADEEALLRGLTRLRRQLLSAADEFRFKIDPEARKVSLRALRLKTTGTGAGTRFMRQVCLLLDEHGFTATGVADPTDSLLDPDTSTLLRWYARFGFEVVGEEPLSGQPVIQRAPSPERQREAASAARPRHQAGVAA